MEHRRSFGDAADGAHQWRRRVEVWLDRELGPRGSAINYLGNPGFRPRLAFRRACITEEMNQRCQYLINHAIVITDEGPMVVGSREKVKDII
jgi:hypothetical protein